eukprot:scaffold141634_cov35-Tisochrysis_lutea.AAC.4
MRVLPPLRRLHLRSRLPAQGRIGSPGTCSTGSGSSLGSPCTTHHMPCRCSHSLTSAGTPLPTPSPRRPRRAAKSPSTPPREGERGSKLTPLAETQRLAWRLQPSTSRKERRKAATSRKKTVAGTRSAHDAQLSPRTRSARSDSGKSSTSAASAMRAAEAGRKEAGQVFSAAASEFFFMRGSHSAQRMRMPLNA